MSKPKDVVQGTLSLLIMKVLALEPMHGWAVSQRIQQVTRNVLQVPQGSLYPALHRLEQEGWIEAEWGIAEDTKRQAKFYRLTPSGRKHLTAEKQAWTKLVGAVEQVLSQT